MNRKELIEALRGITTTIPSMGDVGTRKNGYVKYYPPKKRESIRRGRVSGGVYLAHKIADILEAGGDYDFNSAEFANAGLVGMIGLTFGSQANEIKIA